jgi:hypothetical protein
VQEQGTSSGLAVRGEDSPAPESGQPQKRPTPARPPRFYRLDSRRVTLREYWWGHPAAVLVGGLLKLLRVRLPGSSDDPCVESLSPFEVEDAVFDDETRQKLAPLREELTGLGFHSPIHHLIEDDLHQTDTWLVTLVHESGRAWARVHRRLWTFPAPPKEALFVEFVTPFANGSFLWSLSSKPDMIAPATCLVVRKPKARPAELWSGHQAALQRKPLASRGVAAASTPDAVRASLERHHAAVRAFHVRRGVFGTASASDQAEAKKSTTARRAGGGPSEPPPPPRPPEERGPKARATPTSSPRSSGSRAGRSAA